jgi:ABC-type Fe3+-hydroxamate transport system substrate-binding protein
VAGPLTDAAGNRHAPAHGAVRIVSLVPSITECLCDLGLAGSLVGRTRYCVAPAAPLAAVPEVGGTKDADVAKVLALSPTHVVVNVDENPRATAQAIAAAGPAVVVTHPRAPADNLALFALLGGIFRRGDAADALAAALRARLDAVATAPPLPARRVLYLIWRRPWMTVSRDTYVSRMLALANWETFPPGEGPRYPEIALAQARGQVDLALLSSEPYPFAERHVAEVAAALDPGAAVHPIAGDMISWYGSRAAAGIGYLQDLARRLAASPAGTATPLHDPAHGNTP